MLPARRQKVDISVCDPHLLPSIVHAFAFLYTPSFPLPVTQNLADYVDLPFYRS